MSTLQYLMRFSTLQYKGSVAIIKDLALKYYNATALLIFIINTQFQLLCTQHSLKK